MIDDDGTRAVYRTIKRIPKRPLSATILIVVVVFFIVTSKTRELDDTTAMGRALAHVQQQYLNQCGFDVRPGNSTALRVESVAGEFDNYEVSQAIELPDGTMRVHTVLIWADLTIGPRIPIGDGDYSAFLEFNENIELRDALPAC